MSDWRVDEAICYQNLLHEAELHCEELYGEEEDEEEPTDKLVGVVLDMVEGGADGEQR